MRRGGNYNVDTTVSNTSFGNFPLLNKIHYPIGESLVTECY